MLRRLFPLLIAFTSLTLSAQRVPLNDLGRGTYLGFEGGLYPGGSNEIPPDHRGAAVAVARSIVPLDAAGLPSASGKIVVLSIGMSNTTQEFCSQNGAPPCASWSFVGQALASPDVDRQFLTLVNGARGGQTAETWDSPDDANYARVRDTVLRSLNLTEAQVQVAWVKVANPNPQRSLPASDADAYRLVQQSGNIVRAMKRHYPNLKLVLLSSRIYGGYATTTLNPEPYAYESGLAMKWLIEAQIDQMRNGGRVVNERAGDLDYNGVAPLLAWGPYLWADGLNRRSDGLVWERGDFEADGTHPSQSGEQKVGRMILDFFRTSELTRGWFTASPPPRRRPVRRP